MKLRALAIVTVLFLLIFSAGGVLFPTSPLFAGALSRAVVRIVSTGVELVSLSAGAFFSLRSARRFGAGNPIGTPWRFLAGWFAALLAGQLVYVQKLILHVPNSVPSLADAAYFVGYLCLLASLVSFVRVYRASGFAVGSAVALAVAGFFILLAALAVAVLGSIASAATPLAARLVNVGFPLLDLTALLLIMMLLRMLLPLRGGRVWRVWSAMLAALTLVSCGDVIFAYFYFNVWNHLESLLNLVFMTGYGAGATAAWLQDRALGRALIES